MPLAIDPSGGHEARRSSRAAAVHLTALTATGSNPGNLTGWCHVPAIDALMPLVVVLHGCTQSAAGYDRGSGWSMLAARHGFAVLFPEQQRANNPNGCFNWFAPGDTRRGAGEALSIREMVAAMADRYPIDPARVFVTGLSAGGAMASALLASYPDVFAGGAIIAGLPAGAASNVPQALERMRGTGHGDAQHYADHVRQASDHQGPWPLVSVWHGSADATVAQSNADLILSQWQTLRGLAPIADHQDIVDGAVHRLWRDAEGRVCLEDYRIPGMGHGTPIATQGDAAGGSPAAFMLDVAICSTRHSAARWGLLDIGVTAREQDRSGHDQGGTDRERSDGARAPAVAKSPSRIQDTIEAALRSAGLMR